MNGDGAMSVEALRASLQDIRLPEAAAGGIWADLAAAVALAAVAALLVGLVIRALSLRRVPRRALPLHEALAALEGQPEGARRVGLLHLLRTRAPERYAALQGQLYRPGGVTTQTIERELGNV